TNENADDLFPCENIDEVERRGAHLGRKEYESGTRLDPVDVMFRIQATDFSRYFDRKLSPRENEVCRSAFLGEYKSLHNDRT
ncbi:MAG: hypothetical protein ABEN55_00395, partial [Bradymonadaceae bacterium]